MLTSISWGLWIVVSVALAHIISQRSFKLFPLPPEKPYDVILREQAQAYRPRSEQSRLEEEETAALHAFSAACEFAGA